MVLLSVFAAPLKADIIYFRDGTNMEGLFVTIDQGILIFRTLEEEKQFPFSEITKIEVGYTGVPLCYTTRELSHEKTCPGRLHRLENGQMIIASGIGFLERSEVSLDDIIFLEFRKSKDDQKMLPHLSPGIKLTIERADGSLATGVIASVSSETLELQKSNGDILSFREEDLAGARYVSPVERLDQGFRFVYLFPGWHQIQRGNFWGGMTIIGGFGMFAAAGAAEYSAARKVNSNASSDITFLLFNTHSYYDEFAKHQNNQRYIGAAAGLLYLFHLFDVFRWAPSPGFFTAQVNYTYSVAGSEFTRSREGIHQIGFVITF